MELLTRLPEKEIPPGQVTGMEFYRVNTEDFPNCTTPIYLIKTVVSGSIREWTLKEHDGDTIAKTKISLIPGERVPDEWIVAALQRRYPSEPQEDTQEPVEDPTVSEHDLTEDFALYDVLQHSTGDSYPEEIHNQIERDYPEVATMAIDSQALRLEAEGLLLTARAKLMRATRLVSCYSRKAQELHEV